MSAPEKRAVTSPAAEPRSSPGGRGGARRSLGAALALGALLPAAATADVAAPADDLFERFEVVIGAERYQTVLTGFFLGGAVADVAVVSVDEDEGRLVRIYAFGEGGWAEKVDAALRPGVSFVDVAGIGGRERLITHEPGRLSWFDPDSATERVLVEVATSYNPTPAGLRYGDGEPAGPVDEGEIPHLDVARDVNGDGRDDLILPDLEGFRVLVQKRDGGFAAPVRLGPPEPFRDAIARGARRSYGEVGISALTAPWYLGRMHEVDYDRDGRGDLVFWHEDQFDVHYQDADGLFDPVAETFTTGVAFDSDGAYSLLFGLGDAGTMRLILGLRASSMRTVLHSFRDLNGDRVADLVTLSLEGRSLLRQRSLYEVHFGAPAPGGTSFAREAGTAIRPPGGQPWGYSAAWFEDFDGDGQVDFAFGRVRTGIGGMIRALLGGSLGMDLELYRGADGLYPDRATVRRRITTDFDPRGGRDAGFFPAVLVGDVSGDGRSDLLVGKSREELHVYLGVPGPELLASAPRALAVTVPGDERNSWLVDLDRDGKQDLLMHHPSATEPHRLTVLMAR